MMPVFIKSKPKLAARKLGLQVSPRALLQKYRDNERGIAAIEFAIIAPIMIAMYFGLAEMASAISVDRKISHGTNVAGDLSTQQPEIKDEDIEEVLAAALRVMDIPDVDRVSIDMESFILPAEGDPPQSQGRITVNGSVGNFNQFDATTLDAKLLNATSGVMVTRVRYKYTPFQLRFFDSTITLQETFLLKPRRSDVVLIQDGPGSEITCSATHYSNVSCTASNTGAAAAAP